MPLIRGVTQQQSAGTSQFYLVGKDDVKAYLESPIKNQYMKFLRYLVNLVEEGSKQRRPMTPDQSLKAWLGGTDYFKLLKHMEEFEPVSRKMRKTAILKMYETLGYKGKNKLTPSMKESEQDAYEQEFGEEERPKGRPRRKSKKMTVGQELSRMQNKVLNPKTQRWVKKTSKLGKKILSGKMGRGVKRWFKRLWKNKILPAAKAAVRFVTQQITGVDLYEFVKECKRAVKERSHSITNATNTREVFINTCIIAVNGAITAASMGGLLKNLPGGDIITNLIKKIVPPAAGAIWGAIMNDIRKKRGGDVTASDYTTDSDLNNIAAPQMTDDVFNELEYQAYQQLSPWDQRQYIQENGHPPLIPDWRSNDLYQAETTDTVDQQGPYV